MHENPVVSTLYIVPTPIGNIKDITLRAMEVFRSEKYFLCEDTRVTQKLFTLLEIDRIGKIFESFFEHNETRKISQVIQMLLSGQNMVLVSDAGTPLISDPGYRLVSHIRTNHPDIKIEVLPGASSTITALVASGFPTDKFTYLGYVPRKPSDRKKMFRNIRKSHQHLVTTYLFFENPNRLLSGLGAAREILGENIEVCLCRELTKKFEEIIVSPISEIMTEVQKKSFSTKGELVVLLRFLK